MAQVNISKAIKLAGVSRSTFYSSYIKKGRITILSDDTGKKYVDTSELIRVFGRLKENTENSSDVLYAEQDWTPKKHTPDDLLIEVGQLRHESQHLKEQLSEAQEREAWYKKQIDTLTDTMKLLEAPKSSEPIYPRLWWQFWK